MKIDGKSGTRTEIPFSEPVMDFLSALSERIKSDDLLRSDEEIRAFGFWCRRANLDQLPAGLLLQQARNSFFPVLPDTVFPVTFHTGFESV